MTTIERFELREDYVPPGSTDILPFELELQDAISSEMHGVGPEKDDVELRLLRVENECLRQQLTDVRHQYDQRLTSISTAVGRLHRENDQISKKLELVLRMVEQVSAQGQQTSERFNNAMIRLSSMYPQLHYPFIPTRMPHLNSPGTSPVSVPVVRMPELSTSIIRHRNSAETKTAAAGPADDDTDEIDKRRAREEEDDLAFNAMLGNF